MGPKRQQNPDDKLAVILVANSAARALSSCQIMKELLQEAVESESSKISGNEVNALRNYVALY